MTKVRFSKKRYFIALLRCLWLFAAGPFTERGRVMLQEVGLLLRRRSWQLRLPEIKARDVAGDHAGIRVLYAEPGQWNISALELCVINQLVVGHRPRQMMEIGTFDGRTTLNLAMNAPDDARVYTLDLPPEKLPADMPPCTIGERFLSSDQERKIVQLHGDSTRYDFSPYHDAMDLVFVDARHDYHSVLHDSKSARDLVNKRGGMIVWHDYGVHAGVTHALDELHAERGFFRELRHIRDTSLAVLRVA